MEFVSQGAEARIWRTTLCGERCVVKERFAKRYRHADLDRQLRGRQFQSEMRALVKCGKAGIRVPTLLHADVPGCRLFFKEIAGRTVKQWLGECGQEFGGEACRELARRLGRVIAAIHFEAQMVHGDLTTSNFMVDDELNVYVLDFGLSYHNGDEEDFAVDLYVLERAMISTHPQSEELFGRILKAYRKANQGGAAVINRLNQVRQRGRKKVAFG